MPRGSGADGPSLEFRFRKWYDVAMDCLTFRKNINAYFAKTLSDDELNEFLHHLSECETCREELEINFIVREGVRILDRKNVSYDLSSAFGKNLRENSDHIRFRKIYMRLAYCMTSIAFWALLASVFVYFREMSF